ncbi:unnamed protein product, partial [Ectocarpus sp. 8 AP-2014]
EAKHKKQERGEAKRRREQELAIWKEQREEAKQRKGGGGGKGAAVQTSPGEGKAGGGDADRSDQGRGGASLGAPPEAVVVMRLPDGTSATHSFGTAATLREVLSWLQSTEPTAGKLRGKELQLRCPFPPPGRAIAGDELNSSTVESVGLFPRGRLMVQFSDGATIKKGEGAMPSANNDQAGATRRRRGGGGRFGGRGFPQGPG